MAAAVWTGVPASRPLLAGHFRQRTRYSTYRANGTNDWLLIFTCNGQGRFGQESNGGFIARRGDLVLLRPGAVHDYGLVAPRQPWELQWAHFLPRADWLEWLKWSEIAPGMSRLHVSDSALVRRLSQRFDEMRRISTQHLRQSQALAMNALEEIILWCDEINPEHGPRPLDPRIRRTLDFLNDTLDRPLSLAELARRAGLSASRLAHLFEAEMGLPPRRYMEAIRIEQARRLLARTQLSVGEVSRAVGFENQFYFALRFKKAAGISPRAFRQESEKEGAHAKRRPTGP